MIISHYQTGHIEQCDGILHAVIDPEGAFIGLKTCDCHWSNGKLNTKLPTQPDNTKVN